MATTKLIIESIDWKGGFQIELPNNSSLQDLKDALADHISSPSESLHLSLDKKHELISSPADSLASLGVNPGNPIYFTRYPNKLLIGNDEPPLVKNLSFTSFLSVLQRVQDDYEDHVLLMIAVHVMLLNCGFVSFDIVKSRKIQTLRYSTTRLITERCRSVNLKFEILGGLVSVHRFLNWGNHGAFVWLDKARFAPSLRFVCKNSDSDNAVQLLYHQREVFELWNVVKNGLNLALVVDHFDKMILGGHSAFMCLPQELRLKILEFLPGNDIAKVCCVCAELSQLSLEDDLWKKKCMDEFPHVSSRELLKHQCKYKFALSWKQKKSKAITLNLLK